MLVRTAPLSMARKSKNPTVAKAPIIRRSVILEGLRQQLLDLSPDEKRQLLMWLAARLHFEHISFPSNIVYTPNDVPPLQGQIIEDEFGVRRWEPDPE